MEEVESVDNGPTFDNQDTSEEFKLSNKLLLQIIKYAFVYTTRIDDMKVTKHHNNADMLIEMLQQSKPKYKEKKAKNIIFEKPLNMHYDFKKLKRNPDFNWKKKKISIGYKNLRCLSDARRLCKPVTIDLCKKFEKFLDNGSIKLHLFEQNIGSYSKQNFKKEYDLSDISETISAYSDHSDIENVNPLGIQIVGTCSLSTDHKKEEPIMKNNFSSCLYFPPHRAILVMIDEKQNTQTIFDVQIGSCYEIRSTYNILSSHINIKYCCYCKRNLILENLVKNQVLVPVTTLKYFSQNILCSTNTCDCCCKFAVHTDVICYVDKNNNDAVFKDNAESAVVQSMKKIDSELINKYQYRYVDKYIERGVQDIEEMYVIFSYVKKYSNKYNPKHKYEVYHVDKLSRIKSHLTYVIPPVLRADSPKYMFDLCCWFKRIQIIYSLEIALAKSLTYLRSMHSCTINCCNCCCSALYSTIPLHKDWDVRNCRLPARSISSDIAVHRARWKSSSKYNICAKSKSKQTYSKLNLQSNSGVAESINSTKNVQQVSQKTAELIYIPESDTTSVANSNIYPGSGFDIENSLPDFVLATQTKSTYLPPSLENNDSNMNFDALTVFKQAHLQLTPDGRITAIFSNLEQKLNQDQLIDMCKILNIAQKHVHLIDFNKRNGIDLINIALSKYNESNDSASVPIITDVYSLAEPAQNTNSLKVDAEDAPPPKNVIQPSVSQPNADDIPLSEIHPILYRAILGQTKVSKGNAGNTGQRNVGQATEFIPITIQGQTNYIQSNIPSNIGSIILPDNMILLPNLVVAPNYNTNVVNTVSDNSSICYKSQQGAKRQAMTLPTIHNAVKRFASEKIVTPFPTVNSVTVQGQQENLQNGNELENISESILGV